MRVAITGSSGLIGSTLARSLEADGHAVVRVVRGGAAQPGAVRWDIDAGTIEAGGLDGVDGVVHLAGEGIGEHRWTEAQKRRIRESRTKGTALLAGALAALPHPPPVLVSGSAIGFYGDRGDEPLTEVSPPGTGFLAEVVEAWEAAAEPARSAGIRVATIRTGVVLSSSGGALQRFARLARFGLLGRLGSGRQWMSWISLDDEVAAIRFLLATEVAGAVNLTAPNPVTNAAFTAAIGRVLHRPTVLRVPAFAPKLLVGAELAQSLVLDGQRVVPEVLLRAGFSFQDPDLEPALARLLHG
jgi:uncharacterized protein (TIGR01777 family)